MATPSANALSRVGEEVVARYLDRKGLHVLDRNWRCADGEIDIVALSDATLVVVEVKTRIGVGHGHPLEAIDEVKLRRLQHLARAWRDTHPIQSNGIRIDAAAVIVDRNGKITLDYRKAVS
ncbi:hypothetical protein GALL_401780 [mine drainage metagenome]|uniref:Uncharacterized protein n=1 Tax=mine drainage metagenome TaxID=410659 RepID=A0A1J5QQA7_9ZZZZ